MIVRRSLLVLAVYCVCWIVSGGEAKILLRGPLATSRSLEDEEPVKTVTKDATGPKTTTRKKKTTTKKKTTASTHHSTSTGPVTTTTKKTTEEPKTTVGEEDEEKKTITETELPPAEKAEEEKDSPAQSKETDEKPEETEDKSQAAEDAEKEAEKDDAANGTETDEAKPEEEKDAKESQQEGSQPEKDNGADEPPANDSKSADTYCSNATTCVNCEKLALNSTTQDQTCLWKDSSCELVSKEEAGTQSMCEETKPIPVVDDDEEVTFLPGFIMVLVVASVIIGKRAYAQYGNVPIPGVGVGVATLISRQLSRASADRSSHRDDTETLPLAGTDDDEWGWDDSGGDVELATATSRQQQKEEEDLHMAMALSLSESPPAKKTPKQKVPKGTAIRRMGSGQRDQTDWEDWDDGGPSAARTTAPAPASITNLPPTKITSLGTKKPGMPKRKTEEKPKDEDIFASIGLSAKPKFASRPRASPPSSGGLPTTAATSGLSTAANEVDDDAGSNWDDDSDLDDLLED